MITEIAEITVKSGQEKEFIAAYRGARDFVAVSPGLQTMKMTQSAETPHRFMLLIEWDSIEAHTSGFRDTDRFPKWRDAIGPFFANPPLVEHFASIEK